jgi:hypothetical protein
MLYRSTDRLCRRGAPVKNLSHNASFESFDKDAPAKPGTKHLGARHVPRTKLQMTTRYERIADIDAASRKAAALKSKLIGFLIGPKSEWPEK